MKKILIIENTDKDWEFMASALNAHTVFPVDENNFEILRAKLSQFYSEGNTSAVRQTLKDEITRIVEDADPDIVIVDYILKETNELCNGVSFIQDFLQDKFVLIVTQLRDQVVENSILEFIESRPEKSTGYLLKEPSLNEAFKQRFKRKVADLLKKAEEAKGYFDDDDF